VQAYRSIINSANFPVAFARKYSGLTTSEARKSVPEPVATTDEILFSGDGHVGAPVDLWETRLPERFRERAPRFPDVKYGEGNHARTGGREPLQRLKDMAIDGISAEVL
jgi:hypothetical protein